MEEEAFVEDVVVGGKRTDNMVAIDLTLAAAVVDVDACWNVCGFTDDNKGDGSYNQADDMCVFFVSV